MTTLTGDRSERMASTWARPVPVVLATAPVVFAVGLAAVSLPWNDDGWAGWWPAAAPASVAVALVGGDRLVRHPVHRALLLVGVLAGVGAAGLAVLLLGGRGPGVAAGLALADVAQAAVTGLVLAARGGLCLRAVGDLFRLGAGALGGAAAAGVVALLVDGSRPGVGGVSVVWEVGASRLSAVLLLVPLVMLLPPSTRRVGRAETAAWWVAVIAATLLAIGPAGAPSVFLPMAVLVAVALRLSSTATVVQLAVVGTVLVLATGLDAGTDARAGMLVALHVAVAVVVVLAVRLVVGSRDAALVELTAQRRFDRAVLDGVAAGVVACDADGRVVLRNVAYRRAAGAGGSPDDEIPGVDDPAALRPCERRLVARALEGGQLHGVQARSGPPSDVVADAGPVRSPDGRVLGAVATFTDVTEERAVQARLREAVAFHDAVLAASPDVIFITDVATHRVVWASGTIEPTLGYTPRQVVELDRASRLNLVHPADVEALHQADDAAAGMRDGEVWTVRVRMNTERGEQRWMSRRVTPFDRDADGRVVRLLGVSRDVTEVVEVERRLTDAANRDPLTGALNRRALLERLGVVVSRVTAVDAAATPVLFCDLDGFKAVNDSLGHVAGDRLLTTVAQRISETLRDGDVLARAGGDEFVLLLGPPRGAQADHTTAEGPGRGPAGARSAVLHRARTVGRRILDAVSRPVDVQGARLTVTVSIGIALVRPGIGPDEVLRDADAAMYRAKSTGKNRMHVFEVAPERTRPDPG